MKLFTPLFALVLIAGPLKLWSSNTMNTQEAFHRAKIEQKNIFIQYGSDWCDACSVMRDSILSNPYIQTVLNQEYVVVRADLSKPESSEWFERYQINCLPTIQIIDLEGNVLIEKNSTNEEELYADLLDYAIPKELMSSMEMSAERQDGMKGSEINEKQTVQINSAVTGSGNNLGETSQSSIEPQLDEPGRIDRDDRYTVTIGAYSIFRNAEQFQHSLSLSHDSIEIFIEADPDKKLYRVNAGRFPSRESCQSLVEKLKAQDIDCYLRELL